MATDHILALLIAERDKLSRAIDALGAPVKRRGRPPASAKLGIDAAAPVAAKVRKKRTFSPEQRAAQAAKMKLFWAKKKRAAKKAV